MEPVANLTALAESLALADHGGGAPRLDKAALARLNARTLHTTPWPVISARLQETGLASTETGTEAGADEALWRIVSPNLERLGDLAHWQALGDGTAPPAQGLAPAERRLAAEALAALPPEPWDDPQAAWEAWKSALAREARPNLPVLRRILTGRSKGPEFPALLGWLGRSRTATRLQAAAEDET